MIQIDLNQKQIFTQKKSPADMSLSLSPGVQLFNQPLIFNILIQTNHSLIWIKNRQSWRAEIQTMLKIK